MTIDQIGWDKLRTYAADKRRSFEELCYQLVERDVRGKGQLIRMDGAGGDGGIEMFLKLPNGDEWGWQAKFFWPDVRLETGGRKEQVKRSLLAACANRSRLTRWILMTPGNFTPSESIWFHSELATATRRGVPVVPSGMLVSLEHMGESELLSQLRATPGLRELFFGDLELTLSWFRNVVMSATARIHARYLPEVHSRTGAEETIAYSLGEPQLVTFLKDITKKLANRASLAERERAARDRLEGLSTTPAVVLAVFKEIDTALTQLPAVVQDADDIVSLWEEGTWRTTRKPGAVGRVLVQGVADRLREVLSENGATLTTSLKRYLENADRTWRDIHVLFEAFDYLQGKLSVGALHVFGTAGSGKTHLAAHLANDRIGRGLPAILLLGEQFTSDEPIATQVRKLLHLEHIPWDTIISMLSAYADLHRTRIPIVIDGLNEATRQGGLSPIWRSHLSSFCAELAARTDALVVITTCRDSYQEAVWDDVTPPGKITLRGSASYDVDEAVQRYFAYYRITTDREVSLLGQFCQPIYLRLFCETVNPGRSVIKNIVLGDEDLFSVFDKYMDQCNKRVAQRLNLSRGARPLDEALAIIAKELWQSNSRSCDIDRAYALVDGCVRNRSKDSESVLMALGHEDLLVFRDWHDSKEVIRFTYDLMAGYWIAGAILRERALLDSSGTSARLFDAPAHPLARDIVRCLAARAPLECGLPLRALFEHAGASDAALEALFEINANAITADDVHFVAERFRSSHYRAKLLVLSLHVRGIPEHKLNMDFWHRLLLDVPLKERDLSWSEHVRAYSEEHVRRIRVFRAVVRSWDERERGSLGERWRLFAVEALWAMSSTVRRVRDEATWGLYWYGRQQPSSLITIAEQALAINDPYIVERAIAALYGVVLAGSNDSQFAQATLKPAAEAIFRNLFAANAPHATTHALTRDYARHLLERALIAIPDLFTEAQVRRIRPPFLGSDNRHWPEVPERDHGYRDGVAPIHVDFCNDTLGPLVPGRRNYDDDNEAYKQVVGQVVWRIHDLGYERDSFAVLDREIDLAGFRDKARRAGRTDSYAQKYSWIAYFELWGARHDAGLLEADLFARPTDVDIDPCFPEACAKQDYRLPPIWRAGRVAAANLEDAIFPAELEGDSGPWIVVHAVVSQFAVGTGCTAPGYASVRALLSEDAPDRILRMHRDGRVDLHSERPPSSYYTFAGEVPWADTFPPNEKQIFRCSSDLDGTDVEAFVATWFTRVNDWDEDHRTELRSKRTWVLPTKQVCTALGLSAEPNEWDLFDKFGRRATRNVQYGDSHGGGAQLTFVRRDLVERYLKETGTSLIVAATCVAPGDPSEESDPVRLGWVLRGCSGAVEDGNPNGASGTTEPSRSSS